MSMDLKRSSITGGVITVTIESINIIMQMSSIAILARILSPNEFGLYGMVMTVLVFASIFKDFGLSLAAIQRKNISHSQLSTLFWINAIWGLILTLLIMSLSPLLVWIYDEPKIFNANLVIALFFFISSFYYQFEAKIRRQMRFKVIAIVEVSSLFISLTVSIFLALNGFSYWALILQQVLRAMLQTIGYFVFSDWRPKFLLNIDSIKSMLSFGGNFTAFNFLNYFARNMDKILIGAKYGATELGYYDRAYRILLLPIRNINIPLTKVIIPGLSKLQDDPDKFRNYYLEALSIATFFIMPLSFLLLILADEMILLLLGDQWNEAIPLFKYLAISLFVQPLSNSTGWIYLSRGCTNRQLKWGIGYSIYIVVSFLVGLPYGPKGIAISYSIAMILQTIPSLLYAIKGTKITLRDIFKSIKINFIAALFSSILIFFLKYYFVLKVNNFGQLAFYAILMVAFYLFIVFYVFKKKSYFISILKQIKFN